jgi:coenzyme F420-0:L-glutamate ligase/coenzyme F420-1:gamma-L-glutamate ligase
LAAAMGERLRGDLERDGLPPGLIQDDVSRSRVRITRAPVVIVVCMTMRDMDVYADTRRKDAEWTMAGQSVAMAVQNLLLAAHAVGLGACWMCAPLFVPDTVREVLKLDADWEPQALIAIGYPAEAKAKTRLPLPAVVKYLDTE